jgi:myo-inositol-1(or 4)-monophosphatase
MSRLEDVGRIREALETGGALLLEYASQRLDIRLKERGDPVTEADLEVDAVLRRLLPREGDGWLSEETADDAVRLDRRRVWVVDPLDGTREFVSRIPEWCVSVGLVEEGEAVAGGIHNPMTGELVVGAVGEGVWLNGEPTGPTAAKHLDGTLVLASRSECNRGEWERFSGAGFTVRPMGSVAYKMGLVAAGLADATWTLVPKSEWDVAAGTALVRAAGGEVWTKSGEPPRFNQRRPRYEGFVACAPGLAEPIRNFLHLVP